MHQHSIFKKLLTKMEFLGSLVICSIKPLRNHGIFGKVTLKMPLSTHRTSQSLPSSVEPSELAKQWSSASHSFYKRELLHYNRRPEPCGCRNHLRFSQAGTFAREFILMRLNTYVQRRHSLSKFFSRYSKINYLILTPGILSLNRRDGTSEGIDKKLAVHLYA